MNVKRRINKSACPKAVQQAHKKYFAGKTTLLVKHKNTRIRAVKTEDGNLFFFKRYDPVDKEITVHAILLSDQAVDAMQVLKNKLNEKGGEK